MILVLQGIRDQVVNNVVGSFLNLNFLTIAKVDEVFDRIAKVL